eukprot:CAMPEP_0196587034 /NCGR_PEP_ID=MMETSP1081-20130531/56218_1 /TAXON_ID=36882 /ORGANISM="Pyramimonas amylifera, Strain CCMP720" /LENGTH=324 /DNA_ID=CAMNT_0041909099 /DNA_START=61 /DNA_END=1035 /DNA_ORIENTATION=+
MAEPLTDDHELQVQAYLRFAKMKRDQHVKEVELAVTDVKDYKLDETMFTKDDVVDILDNLNEELQSSVEKELTNSAHSSALLLRLLFHQAESGGLELAVDTNKLENEFLLSEVKKTEELALSKPASAFLAKKTNLSKISASVTDPKIVAERDQLREEVQLQKDRLAKMQIATSNVTKEKIDLTEQINKMKLEATSQKGDFETSLRQREDDLLAKEEDFKKLQRSLEEADRAKNAFSQSAQDSQGASSQKVKELEGQISEVSEELRVKKLELERAEKQVSDKLNESKQFLTMKKMMQTKSQQVTQLRKRLAMYEPPDAGIQDADV